MPIRVPVEQTGLERSIQNAAKKAGRNLKLNLGTSAKDIKSLEQPLGRITGKADEFTKSIEASNARVIAFGASVGIINGVVQSFKNLVATTIEVEKNLAKINSILQTTGPGLENLKRQIFEIAKNTEQTFDTVSEAALELSRQGLSATEVTKRLNDSLILSRLSGISAAEAVAGLTAAVNSFSKEGLTTSEVLNKISNAANQFAVSERDLIEGFKRSASVAQQAGVSIDELGGIITAVQQRTARGGAVIGNSFKTIFTRIGKADNLKLLQDVGVAVSDLEGNILPATTIIENLAKKFDELDGAVQRNVAFKIGGGFQIAPLLAALQDYSEENSIAIRATEAFATATDQAYKKNIALNQTLSAAINSTSLSIKELANTLGEIGVTDVFKELLNDVTGIANFIQKIFEGEGAGAKIAKGLLKGFGDAFIKGGLAVFGTLILKLSVDLAKFGLNSVKTFFGLNKEAQALKNTQAQIVSTLLSDASIRENILSIETKSISVEQKRKQQADLLNIALNEQLKKLSQINAVAAGISLPLAQTQGLVGGRTIRRSAGGFLPIGAEQSDISKGVGGAPASAKPVVIPNFAFGGGQKGTMVANTSEYIVPNFAGGGDAIFNQDMVKSMGLPSGAKKINAAGGFIPNFAALRSLKPVGNKIGDYRILLSEGSNTKGQFQRPFGSLSAEEANKALKRSRSKAGLAQDRRRKTYDINVNKVLGSDIPGMLIPRLGGGKKFGKVTGSKVLQSKYPGALLNATFPAFPIDLSSKKELKQEIQQTFGKGEIEKYVTDRAVRIAQTIASSFALPPVEPNTINAVDNVKGFISSAVGAFGGIFDAAMTAAIGLNSTDEKGVGDFDVDVLRSKSPQNIAKVFGGRSITRKYLDNKINQDQGKSMLQKTLSTKEYRDKIEEEALTQGKKLGFVDQKTKKAAKGYIPNYAMSPLEDAIQREKEAGVPVNQIRINQDGKLRNSQNPQGLAVTNTRDEPTGRIPSNAAAGYIPNYNRLGGGFAGFDKRTIAAQKEYADSLKNSTNQVKKQTTATQDQTKTTIDSAGKFALLSGPLFLLQGAFGGLATETEGLGKSFSEVTQGVIQAATTFSILQSAGIGGGVGGGTGFLGLSRKKPPPLPGAKPSLFNAVSQKVTSAFAGIGKFGARLVPFLGQAVIAYQVLNPILKQFGVDLSSITSGFKSSSDSFVESVNKSQKAFDTFGEKLAQGISSGEFSGKNLVEDFTNSYFNKLKAQLSGLDVEGPVTEDLLTRVALRGKASVGQLGIPTEKGSVAREASFANFFTNAGNIGGVGLAKEFNRAFLSGLNDSSKSFSFRGAFFGRETSDVIKGTDIDIKDPEVKKAIESARGNFNEALNSAFVSLVSKQEIEEQEIDLSTKEGVNKAIGIGLGKITEKDKDAAPKIQSAFDSLIEEKSFQELSAENQLLKVGKLLKDLGYEDVLESIIKQNKTYIEQQKKLGAVKKINADIFKLKTDEVFKQQQLLRSIRTQQEFQLELEASSIKTSAARKLQIQQELRGVEDIRKARLKVAETIRTSLSGNESIKTLLTEDLNKGIDVEVAKNYEQIVNRIALGYAETGELNEDLLESELEKIGVIKGGEDARDRILNAIREEVKLASQSITLEQVKKNLYEDQKRLIELRNEAEKDLLDIVEKNLDIQEKAAKSRLQQQVAAIEKEKELRGIRFGGGRVSVQSVFDRQSDRAIESIRRKESEQDTFSKIRKDLTSLATQRGVGESFRQSDEFKRFLDNRSEANATAAAKKLDEIIGRDRGDQEQRLTKSIEGFRQVIDDGFLNKLPTGLSEPANKILEGGTKIEKAAEKIERAFTGKSLFAGLREGISSITSKSSGSVLGGQQNKLSKAEGELSLLQKDLREKAQSSLNFQKEIENAEASLKGFNTVINSLKTDEDKDKFRELKRQKEIQLKNLKDSANTQGTLIANTKELIREKENEIEAIKEFIKKLEEFKPGEAKPKTIIEKPKAQKISDDDILGIATPEDSPEGITGFRESIAGIPRNIADLAKILRLASTATPIAQTSTEGDLEEQENEAKIQANREASDAEFFNAQRVAANIQYQTQLIKARDAASIVAAEREFKLSQDLIKNAIKYNNLSKGASKERKKQLEEEFRLAEAKIKAESENISLSDRFREKGLTDKQAIDNLRTSLVEGADQFVNTLASGINDAIVKGEDLGDVLRSAAFDFFNTLAKQSLQNIFKQISFGTGGGGGIFGGIGKILGFNQGGIVNGGSGTKDDVPALLTGGEYVMKKSSVQKYGDRFMEDINSGKAPQGIQKFANGGLVKKREEEIQTGGGGFFVPGTYGGTIEGKEDLLSFATQSFTSGARDVVFSGGDASGGYAGVNLEPESVRLTNFGRKLGTPLQQATQSAKEQAFGVYTQQLDLEKQYQEQLEAYRQAKKARKKALRNQLISAAVSFAISAGASGFGKGFKNVKAPEGVTKGVTNGFLDNPSFLQRLGSGFKASVFGGAIPGQEGTFGGLKNIFSPRGYISDEKDLFEYIQKNPNSSLAKNTDLFGTASKAYTVDSGPQTLAQTQQSITSFRSNIDQGGLPKRDEFDRFYFNTLLPPKATGGYIPDQAGVDTVPAMLSGGEFIMNTAAADRIGRGNLEKMNSGVSDNEESKGIANDELLRKLDDLIEATKESTGEINITVNGESGREEEDSQGQGGDGNRQFAKKLKEEVVKIIQEEKRLGGSLRGDKL